MVQPNRPLQRESLTSFVDPYKRVWLRLALWSIWLCGVACDRDAWPGWKGLGFRV